MFHVISDLLIQQLMKMWSDGVRFGAGRIWRSYLSTVCHMCNILAWGEILIFRNDTLLSHPNHFLHFSFCYKKVLKKVKKYKSPAAHGSIK